MNLIQQATISLLSARLFLAERRLEKNVTRLRRAECDAEYSRREVVDIADELRRVLGVAE